VVLIREVVKQAIKTGCLTLKAEEELRILLKKKYGLEDFEAFIQLQQAVMRGTVKQESREIVSSISK
jgi:hypothetical protein